MLFTRTVTRQTIKINYNNVKTNGGYITYFKLIPDFFSDETKAVFKVLSLKNKIKTVISLSLQLIFKPLLSIFNTTTKYKGFYILENDNLIEHKIKKIYFVYLFRVIPIFGYFTHKLNENDFNYILK